MLKLGLQVGDTPSALLNVDAVTGSHLEDTDLSGSVRTDPATYRYGSSMEGSYVINGLPGSIIVPPDGDAGTLADAQNGTPAILVLDCRVVRPDGERAGLEVMSVEGYLNEEPWFLFARDNYRYLKDEFLDTTGGIDEELR